MKQLIAILAICTLGYVFDHWQALAERHGMVSTNSPALIVYGSKSSPPCVQLEWELKKLGISYEKRDTSDPDVSRELTDKLLRVGKMHGTPAIPAAEVGGIVIEGASVEDIVRRLR